MSHEITTPVVTETSTAAPSEAEAPTAATHWSVPAADVLRRGGDLRVCVDLPGVEPDGLEVEVTAGVLQVTARRADQPGRGYRRRFQLPDHVDADAVHGALAHGVLQLDLPQAEAARPRSIPVDVG